MLRMWRRSSPRGSAATSMRPPQREPAVGREGTVVVTDAPRGRLAQEIQAGRHVLIADEPAGVGDDLGPTPYDLLLASLGACTAMTLRLYAAHKGWPLAEVSVELRHDRVHADDSRDCPTTPCRIDRIERIVTSRRAAQRRATPAPPRDRREMPGPPHAHGREADRHTTRRVSAHRRPSRRSPATGTARSRARTSLEEEHDDAGHEARDRDRRQSAENDVVAPGGGIVVWIGLLRTVHVSSLESVGVMSVAEFQNVPTFRGEIVAWVQIPSRCLAANVRRRFASRRPRPTLLRSPPFR